VRYFENKLSFRTFIPFYARFFLRENSLFANFGLASMSVFARELPEELEFEVSDCGFAFRVIAFDCHFYLFAWIELVLLNKNFSR
jgi:hypothetical protein